MKKFIFAVLLVSMLAMAFTMPAFAEQAKDTCLESSACLLTTDRYDAMAAYYLGVAEFNSQKSMAANTARYNGLAEVYMVEDETIAPMSVDVTRYNAMAAFYLGKAEINRLRSGMADTARFEGLADYYFASR